jgi:hypothetical protein
VPCGTESKNKSQRAAVLRRTVQYVRWIQIENENLRIQLNLPEQDPQAMLFEDDQAEQSSHGSRSSSVESEGNSDQGEDSSMHRAPSRMASSGTFHTFSLSNNDLIIDINSG